MGAGKRIGKKRKRGRKERKAGRETQETKKRDGRF